MVQYMNSMMSFCFLKHSNIRDKKKREMDTLWQWHTGPKVLGIHNLGLEIIDTLHLIYDSKSLTRNTNSRLNTKVYS